MCVAQCPWLADDPSIANRIGACLVAAIGESLTVLDAPTKSGDCPPVTLLVNLPSQRPGLPESLGKSVLAIVEGAFSGVFSRIGLAQLGHAGGIVALQSAIRVLAEIPGTACVIAGADSYMDPDMLEWLEETDQLHGAGERNNAWGFVPGEGAGALLLVAPDVARRLAIQPLGRVGGVGAGHETKLNRTGTVCLGEGLTTAFRGALAGLPIGAKLTDVYCDMNGDPYRADEFAFTVTRTRERFVAASDFVAPADCWGDVGAASGPLFIALACVAGTKAYAKGTHALVWASSDTGQRGSALIETTAGR